MFEINELHHHIALILGSYTLYINNFLKIIMANLKEAADIKQLNKLITSKGSSLKSITDILDKYPNQMPKIFAVAIEKGRDDVLNYILKNRDQSTISNVRFINTKNPRGYTALHLAVEAGHKEIIELLVNNGADLSIKNNKLQRADEMHIKGKKNYLMELTYKFRQAIQQNDTDTVNEFINKNRGWLTLPLTPGGATVLHEALQRKQFELFNYFLDKLSKELNMSELSIVSKFVTRSNKSVLHYAAKAGDINIIEKILNLGVDVNQAATGGITPLHLAAEVGNKEAVDFLIKKGADVSVKNDKGLTPYELAKKDGEVFIYFNQLQQDLFQAIQSYDYEKLDKVIKDTNVSILLLPWHDQGVNALTYAVENQNVEMVIYIVNELSKRGNINSATLNPELLKHAIKANNSDVLNYLIANGADVTAEENYDLLHRAVLQGGNPAIIETLINNGVDVSKSLEYNGKSTLAYQIDNKEVPNFKNHLLTLTQTFREAIEVGDIPTIDAYLKKNPSWLNLMTGNGTIFHIAARNNNTKLIEFLMNNLKKLGDSIPTDTNIYSRDKAGLTPFDYLAFYERKAFHDELFIIRQASNFSQGRRPQRFKISYEKGQENVLNAVLITEGALLPVITKFTPEYIVKNEAKSLLNSLSSKTRASIILEAVKSNNAVLDYILNDKQLRKTLHIVAHKNPNFVGDLITSLSSGILSEHDNILKKLMAESVYARRGLWQKLKTLFGLDPFDVEVYSRKFMDHYIDNYGNNDESAYYLKAKMFQGFSGYEVDIEKAEEFYEKISKNDILKYIEARYELANIYIANEQTAEAKIILQDVIDTAKQAFIANPKSIFLKNMISDVEQLSSMLDKTLSELVEAAKLKNATKILQEAVDRVVETSAYFKKIKLSESRYCIWKPEPAAKTENPEPSVVPQNTTPKAGL